MPKTIKGDQEVNFDLEQQKTISVKMLEQEKQGLSDELKKQISDI